MESESESKTESVSESESASEETDEGSVFLAGSAQGEVSESELDSSSSPSFASKCMNGLAARRRVRA